ncbi:MAG: hypothetical protein KKD99_13645 [Proteobacteria bacterium]|nr:hypothetical protein [Pseudomonadota bacterium]
MDKLIKVVVKIIKVLAKILKWIAIFLSIPALYASVMLTYNYCSKLNYNKFRQAKPFDAKVWQKTDVLLDHIEDEEGYGNERYTRCYMYNDLAKNYLHFNMSYTDVVKLLGESDFVDYYTNPELKLVRYPMGGCDRYYSLPFLDTRYTLLNSDLCLYFDRDSKLVALGAQDIYIRVLEPLLYGHRDDIGLSIVPGVSLAGKKALFKCEKLECKLRVPVLVGQITFIDWKTSKKDEVKSKWDYEVW